MPRQYNTSKYMPHWPLALPYPYEITRSRRPVPNASSVDWPQAQFAPLYLPPGAPSFQPYRYHDKPRRYPAGAKVFSIWPGPNTLPFSTRPMNERLRRQWMRRPDGDIIRVSHGSARRNPSALHNGMNTGTAVYILIGAVVLGGGFLIYRNRRNR